MCDVLRHFSQYRLLGLSPMAFISRGSSPGSYVHSSLKQFEA